MSAWLVELPLDPGRRLCCSECMQRHHGLLAIHYLFDLEGNPEHPPFELRRNPAGVQWRLIPPLADVPGTSTELLELIRAAAEHPPQWQPFDGTIVVCVGCRIDLVASCRRFDLRTGEEAVE